MGGGGQSWGTPPRRRTIVPAANRQGPKPRLAQAVVASFQAPAPPTQAAFFFHATETFNPCMWATDADFSQVSYEPANGQPPCPGCMVAAPPFPPARPPGLAKAPCTNVTGPTPHTPSMN